MRALAFAVLMLASSGQAWARKLPTGEFLSFPLDVRSAAFAEAGQALASGAGAVTFNPVALHGVADQQVYFTHAFLFESIRSDFLSYGLSRGPHHFGLIYHHVGYGSLDGRDIAGNSTGGFGPDDTVYGLSYATFFKAVEIAGTYRFIDSEIVESARTSTFDLGARYRINDEWVAAASGRQIGGSLKYEQESDPLPTQIAAGFGWTPSPGWRLAADLIYPLYQPSFMAFGSEYTWSVAPELSLSLRAGANTKTPDLGILSNLKAGFGLRYRAIEVDYALHAGGELGQAHLIGLGYRFGRRSRP
ncbi:MAG: PorV/PorQ family protein [Elusimicrobia bacterium]|nr:PorV/PorQ family protein [Elusimicrobiota bacterium]